MNKFDNLTHLNKDNIRSIYENDHYSIEVNGQKVATSDSFIWAERIATALSCGEKVEESDYTSTQLRRLRNLVDGMFEWADEPEEGDFDDLVRLLENIKELIKE